MNDAYSLPEDYAAAIRRGECVLVHPREDDVRRIIAAHPQRESNRARLMMWIIAVRGAYSPRDGRGVLARQGWGPMVARIARGMGVYQ